MFNNTAFEVPGVAGEWVDADVDTHIDFGEWIDADDDMILQTQLAHELNHVLHRFRRTAGLHDDNHGKSS